MPDRPETEHELRLSAILERGDAGTWRDLAKPNPTCLNRLDALDAAAPHMGEVTGLVRRHVQAALAIGLHIQLPPLMLLGEPGMGKSWYLVRLGEALGLPVRTYPMSTSTLGEGLQGHSPSWRNAGPGCPPSALMRQTEGFDEGGFLAHRSPQGAKMSQKAGQAKPPAENVVKEIRRATRTHYSAEDKIASCWKVCGVRTASRSCADAKAWDRTSHYRRLERQRIKRQTLLHRRLQHIQHAA